MHAHGGEGLSEDMKAPSSFLSNLPDEIPSGGRDAQRKWRCARLVLSSAR